MSQKVYKTQHWVCFVLANYSRAWGMPWSGANIPSKTTRENTDFLFSIESQLQIIS